MIGESDSAPSLDTHLNASAALITDPTRRTDVLLRVRREEGHQTNAWWFVGAFFATLSLILLAFSFVPTAA